MRRAELLVVQGRVCRLSTHEKFGKHQVVIGPFTPKYSIIASIWPLPPPPPSALAQAPLEERKSRYNQGPAIAMAVDEWGRMLCSIRVCGIDIYSRKIGEEQGTTVVELSEGGLANWLYVAACVK